MIKVYGINNCDTVKKARTWLTQQSIDYQFHDFRVLGITQTQVRDWIGKLGLEALINKRSTTWKSLDETARASLDERTAPTLMVANPTLIKRPLLEADGICHTGFSVVDYQRLLLR